MSRHRVMANLDYHEELSDVEGGEDAYDDEVDQEAMREGKEKVIRALGDTASMVPEKEVEQALWDNYYDVDKAVDTLTAAYLEETMKMNDAAAEVLQRLGEKCDKVTAKQIKDSLWHYYYDVEKAIAYLDRTYINPVEKPKPKPKVPADCKYPSSSSFFGHIGSSEPVGQDEERASRSGGGSRGLGQGGEGYPVESRINIPAAWYFHDMPWMGVPQCRQAVLVAPPRVGGLLGGADSTRKMSKLQALAAARKNKKAAEKKPSDEGADTPAPSVPTTTSPPTAGKGSFKLDIRVLPKKQPGAEAPSSAEKLANRGQKSAENIPDAASEQVLAGASPNRQDTPVTKEETHIPPPQAVQPSAFASTLFGSASDASLAKPQTYPMPYTSSPSFSTKPFLQPSPDDIVMAAQAQAGKKVAAPAQKKVPKGAVATPANSNVEAVAEQLGKLSAKTEARPKSKQLDVLKEYENAKKDKKSASFVVVGHVDAGKSTLMGRLLLELKFVDKSVVDKYRRQAEKIGKQSFELAWVMDQREEERDRGVTIDIATNHFETDKGRYTILDAPGHKDFIPNMIAGASQADFAILVVDSSTGAFEKGLKGQTREHVLLLRALGVHRLIIAVNKMDASEWSRARYDEISEQVMGFLSAKGFLAKNVTFVPISGYEGHNLTRRPEAPEASWYKGETLIQALDASEPAPRSLRRPFRMGISEVWKSPLGHVTVSGRIDTGTVQVGDALVVQPSGEEAYVKTIMADADLRDWAVAGENVSIFLAGIDPVHLRVGDIASGAAAPIGCGQEFRMKAMAFEHVMPMPVDLHRGRLHAAGRIVELEAILDKATGEIVKRRPKVVKPGEVARVVVKLGSKIPLEAGQRVVIRSGGETVAAGLLE